MAEGETGDSGMRMSVSSPGAFLIALLLGAGLMLLFHLYQVRRLERELDKLRIESEVAKKEAIEAWGALDKKIRELEKKK